MAMYDLVIIHSQDTTAWTDYILGYLDRGSFNKKTHILRDADLVNRLDDAETRSAISTAKAVIIIASPIHLQFLIECPTFSYFGLVPDIRRAQIFLCGSEMIDFDVKDLEGQSIFKRFPDFFNWKTLTHDKHAELLTNAMILMEADEKPASPATHKVRNNGSNGGKRRRKREFEITPTKIKCQESTTVTLLFAESIADSADQFGMEVVFRERNVVDSVPIIIEAKWRNPHTYRFLAPDLPLGVTSFTVRLNGTEIGTKKLTYYSGQECLTQIYIHQMARLCRYIHDVGSLTSKVDSLLSEILDESLPQAIPVQAFENIFGSYCFKNEEQSLYEFPTLLHLAAKFGFQEFATKLIDLPDARQAYDIRNTDGQLPEIIARDSGHQELARLFQDFHVVNETISSVYDIYLPEQRQSHRLSDTSEYSVTPTAVLSSSGSEDIYMEMRGKSPCKTEKKENSESDNDEGSYIDMDEEELSETIQKQKQEEELKRHVKPETSDKHIEQYSQEQQDFQRPTQKTAEQTETTVVEMNTTTEQPRTTAQQTKATTQQSTTTAEQTKTDDAIRLESLTLEDVPNISDVPDSQKELIGILTTVIQGKISVAEGECLIKGWNFRHNHGRSRSFKEKQAQLSKMRDQVTKAKDKIKEPSWWNSVITVLKKRPSNASSAQPAVASNAENPNVPGLSTSKSIRQPALQESLAIGTKTRKVYKVPITPDPRTFENVPYLLEPISESPQRNSNTSASSRESLLSVTSRTSTSSGVDIDTVDEEHMSELELRVRNQQQGNLDYAVRHAAALCKRKSRNLEILEEELTCVDAPNPPPLPPRAGPRAESFRSQAGKHSPTSTRSVPPIKHSITSVRLPPMPHQTRNRSSSDGCILLTQPSHQLLASGHPPWKSFDQPPPISPRLLKRDTLQLAQRRPAPTVPTLIPEDSSVPATHPVGKSQQEADSIVNRPYIQCPVPAAGRAYVIRSRSRETRANKGSISKQSAVADPDIVMLETTDDRNLWERCESPSPLEFKAAPTYRVLRALTSPELTQMYGENKKMWPRYQADTTQTMDTSEKQTTAAYQQRQQQHQQQQQPRQQAQSLAYQQHHDDHQLTYKQQRQEEHYVDVRILPVDATALAGGLTIEEVSTIEYVTIESPLFQAESIGYMETSEEQPTEEHQQFQKMQRPEVNSTDVKNLAINTTTMIGRQESEEVLNEEYATVGPLSGSDVLRSESSSSVDEVLLSPREKDLPITSGCLRKDRRNLTTNRPPPVIQIQELVFQTNQVCPLVLPAGVDTSAASEVEDFPFVKPGIFLLPCQVAERAENIPIRTGTPTKSGIPTSTEVTAITTTGVYDTACRSTCGTIQGFILDSHCRSSEIETSFDELKNLISPPEEPPRVPLVGSTNLSLVHSQKAGSPGLEEDRISTRKDTFSLDNSTTEAQLHISKVTPVSELELGQSKVLPSETLDQSTSVSEPLATLPSTDVIQVSSSKSTTMITAEPQKPVQMNASDPCKEGVLCSTKAFDSERKPNKDTTDTSRTRKGLSHSLKHSVKKSGSDLERTQQQPRPAANFTQLKKDASTCSSPEAASSRLEHQSELGLGSISLKICETAIEEQSTECGTVVQEPYTRQQSSKAVTDELLTSEARTKKCLPAKPPKTRRADSSSSASCLEEQPHKQKPATNQIQDEVSPDVVSSSPLFEKSPSPVAGRLGGKTVPHSDCDSSVKSTAPPRVPSKTFKGARK